MYFCYVFLLYFSRFYLNITLYFYTAQTMKKYLLYYKKDSGRISCVLPESNISYLFCNLLLCIIFTRANLGTENRPLFPLFPTINTDCPGCEFSSPFSAHLVNVLCEFSSCCIHLSEAKEDFIRTLIKMI